MGCPWDSNTTNLIAQLNNFEMMKYAYENGCPWDQNTTTAIAQN